MKVSVHFLIILSFCITQLSAMSRDESRVALLSAHTDSFAGLFQTSDDADGEPVASGSMSRIMQSDAPVIIAGGAVAPISTLVAEKLLEAHNRTPLALLAFMSPDVLRAGVIGGVSIASLFFIFQAKRAFSRMIEAPYAKEVAELRREVDSFERKLTEKYSIQKHELDELVEKRFGHIEDDMHGIVKEWFKEIDANSAQLFKDMLEEHEQLIALQATLADTDYAPALGAIIALNKHNQEQLSGLHVISDDKLRELKPKHGHGLVCRLKKMLHLKKH